MLRVSRIGQWADRGIQAGLWTLLIATPLALGTVQPWSIALAETMTLALVVCWLLPQLLRGEWFLSLPTVALPAGAFLILAGIQLIPLPPGLLHTLAPRTAEILARTETSVALPPGVPDAAPPQEPRITLWHPLSLDPERTAHEGGKLLAYAGLFLAVQQLFRNPRQVRRTVWLLATMGIVIALLGLMHLATWNGKLYWLVPLAHGGGPMGPYVGQAHFAGYLLIVVPVVLGYVMVQGGRARSAGPRWELAGRRGPHEPVDWGRAVLKVFVFVMGGAILVSSSRGGMASLIFALLVVGGLTAFWRGRLKAGGMVLLAIGLIVAVGLWVADTIVVANVEELVEEVSGKVASARVRIWADALALWGQFPLLGTGLGTFGVAFPMIQTLPTHVRFWHAESDVIQMLTDTGLVGWALYLLTWGWLFVTGWHQFRAGPEDGELRIGVLGALAGTFVHGIANYNAPPMANWIALTVAVALLFRHEDVRKGPEARPLHQRATEHRETHTPREEKTGSRPAMNAPGEPGDPAWARPRPKV